MTALPPLASLLSVHRSITNAYELCLETERKCTQSQLVYARILGYLLLNAPSSTAQECVVNDIIACTGQSDRLKLGETYMNQFIRPFQRPRRSTPARSRDTPSPSSDDIKDATETKLVNDRQTRKEAKASALIRDNFRCMVTKKFDVHSALENVELGQICLASIAAGGPSAELTQCCHIFPEPLTTVGLLESGSRTESAAASWTLLERFGYAHIIQEIDGKLIHRPENIMTMTTSVHEIFERLGIWFEATDDLNHYTVKARNDELLLLLNIPTSVKFVSADETIPLPSPQYLALHALCARVAHLSGAAEYIESFYKDMENTDVLSVDGSSADLLSYALLSSGVTGMR